MTLNQKITLLAQHTATTIKNLKVKIGDLATLNTTNKDTVVDALNEIKGLCDDLANATSIDDVTASSDTVYSSTKTIALIEQAKTDIIGGAALDSDTLKELSDKILANAEADNGLVSALAVQSFTVTQKGTARANIDAVSTAELATVSTVATTAQSTATAAQSSVTTLANNIGNTDHDFVADFNSVYNA